MERLRNVGFGKTGLEVTNICIGAAPIGGMPYGGHRVSEIEAIQTLLHVFESPIRFLDTASIYEESELRIGKAIRAFGGLPENFVIATKADRDPQTGDFSADQVKRSVDKSLEILGIDKLPIVYLHDPEHSSFTFEEITAEGGPVEELKKLKTEGLIGHIGISGGPIDMMIDYVNTGEFEAVITHNRYTLLSRLAEPLIERASQLGLAVVNAAVYNGGILAKGAESFPYYVYQEITKEVVNIIKRLEGICKEFNVSLPAVALQFSLRNQKIASTVVGMSSPEEIYQNLTLAEIEIPEGLWIELARIPTVTTDPETK